MNIFEKNVLMPTNNLEKNPLENIKIQLVHIIAKPDNIRAMEKWKLLVIQKTFGMNFSVNSKPL